MHEKRVGTPLLAFAFALGTAAAALPSRAAAQEDETGKQVAERIHKGGWFEQSRWRRGDDGQLQVHYIADIGGSFGGGDRFRPLLGEDFKRGLQSAGLIGYLVLLCHGHDDLVGMTDAGLHFDTLGIDDSDVGLRQFLALPMPDSQGERRRAEVLDRVLAISELERRRCKGAVGELQALARDGGEPMLIARARRALAALADPPQPLPRERLDPERLELPLAFDACVVIDHARLPDMGWLTALGRRLGALTTCWRMNMAGGTISPAAANGAQVMCDTVSELPFGIALRYGNARLDHSCVVITAQNDPKVPVALSWQAAGEFESDRWQDAKVPEGLGRNNPLLTGTLAVEPTRLLATLGGSAGKPRPAQAKELLRDTGLAVRVIVPPTSKLWASLAFLELPQAKGAELRVSCGDAATKQPTVIVLMVQARDEDSADEWLEHGKQLLAAAKEGIGQLLPPAVGEHEDGKRVIAALVGAALSVKGDAVFATVELPALTPAAVLEIAELFFAE